MRVHKRLNSLFLILLVLSFVLPSAAPVGATSAANKSPNITYTYDANGRLTSVTDPKNGSATYKYDAVGNLLSITGSSATDPSSSQGSSASDQSSPPRIDGFFPAHGPSGSAFTITGGNFSTVPGENLVKVGNLFAIVKSSSPGTIVATIPPGAKSGAITVTTPSGSATSTGTLSVDSTQASSQAPLPPPGNNLPALQAPPGVTAVAGRVLRVDGEPLAGVKISVSLAKGIIETQTDDTGRFLLKGLTAGHQQLFIDADGVRTTQMYGLYEEGVDLVAGKTTVLPWVNWLSPLDMQHSVSFPSPTTHKIVIKNPHIPGLEIDILPGTVITDHWGKLVTRVGITPIPIERAPMPLAPGMPLFYTLQPGGSYILRGPGLRIIYPNVTHQPPGHQVEFVSNDAGDPGFGWSNAGSGTVSRDGSQIIPDHMRGAYKEFRPFGVNFFPLCNFLFLGLFCPPAGNCGGNCGDPIDLSTGLFQATKTDLLLPDVLPVDLTRTYRDMDSTIRDFGMGTSDPLDLFIAAGNNSNFELSLPNGSFIQYTHNSQTGNYDAIGTPTQYFGSVLHKINDPNYTLTLKNGTIYTFGSYRAALIAIQDRYGNTISISRDYQSGRLQQVTTPNGRWISFTYGVCVPGQNPTYCITQAQDNMGRSDAYSYDVNGRLVTATDVNNQLTTYNWAPCSSAQLCTEMTSITDPRKIAYITNTYDPSTYRVTQQTQGDGGSYGIAYQLDQNQKVIEADVTDPRQNIRKVLFDGNGYTTSDTHVQETTTYVRDPNTNLITSTTDALNRTTAYTYDPMGNVLSITELSGSQHPITTTFTYEPVYNRLATVTDPLNHTATINYDDNAQTVTAIDPLGNQEVMTMIGGQPVKFLDPLKHATYFSYLYGNLVAIADPLGRVTTRYYDAGARLMRVTDPLKQYTQYKYDNFNNLTSIKDPLGNTTSIIYDPNGDVTSVTDANGNLTKYTYDAMDRLQTRTDALGKANSYVYDKIGNLTQFTDRNGTKTTYQYDPLNREKFAGFGAQDNSSYQSTISYTYDAGNRLITAVDSQTGTDSATFDGLNRLTSETTPNGSVSYLYDDASRQTQMTVTGQAPVNYSYDNGNRLTSIKGGSQSVTFTYDNADRRTSLTLPDGIKGSYNYDAASDLTGITYVNGKNKIGNLTYGYDKDAQRSSMGGNLASTSLPQPITSAKYNADNELISLNGTSLAYDNNGALLNDGTSSYSWDARQQLSTITGGGTTAAFSYDPFERRTQKTVNGTSTGFLYDGVNPVQELSSGQPSANIFGGLRTDEIFSRTDSKGTQSYLTDSLGSTVGLADSSGNVITSYTYDPYGKTTVSGSSSTNSYQYTGRENDGTGLYFNRARYYSPSQQRFISQDPIEFASGTTNLYAYTGNSPTNFVDSGGTQLLPGCVIGAGLNVLTNWLFSGRKGYSFGQGVKDAAVGCAVGAVGAWIGELGTVADDSATILVRHYTSDTFRDEILQSGVINPGSYVTLPSEIPADATQAEIERLLEIKPGRGANYFEFRIAPSDLRVPEGGPFTSGGAWQRQTNVPVQTDSTTGSFGGLLCLI